MALSLSLWEGVVDLRESHAKIVSRPTWGRRDWNLQLVGSIGEKLCELLWWQSMEKGLDLLREQVRLASEHGLLTLSCPGSSFGQEYLQRMR